jgi:putative peptidoglycan lipid II flippase
VVELPGRPEGGASLNAPQPSGVLPPGSPADRAEGNPLLRGGLILVAGVLTGNLVGFGRVALTAYLLGTHSRADSLAVAMGPVDTLNSVLINSVVFAFVPMLTARSGVERIALFLQLTRGFLWVSCGIAMAAMGFAPLLMRALAPGLDAESFGTAVNVLRLLSVSTLAAGTGAVQCAMLYTERRFAPTAFYQASLNLCTIVSALALWSRLGVYAFPLGYTLGAWVQLAMVSYAARAGLQTAGVPRAGIGWREILAKPAFFVVYAAGLGLNITFTRSYATHAGPGMAAALDYCMRGVGVPLAILVSPISHSLLPEIARLRSLCRFREALRLIDRTIALAALAVIAGCACGLLFRKPAIALLFQRGNFTVESTRLVAAVFLGLGPSLIGWSLIEITSRALFALDRPWPPVIATAVPVFLNVIITMRLHDSRPEFVGLGASAGLLAGFALLFVIVHARRSAWLGQA